MGRGVRSGMKRGNSQNDHVKNKDSEDSDEDYVAEVDEVDEQSEELESLVGDGDASEEGSYFDGEQEEDEDDDGEEEWRVKSTARKTPTKPKKNGIKRGNKRRKVVRSDDDDEDDDDYEVTSDEEFTPDEVDSLEEEEEEEFPPAKKRTKKRGRGSLVRRSSASDEEEFTLDDDEIDSLEEEEEEFCPPRRTTKKRGRTSSTRRKSGQKRGRKTNAKAARKPVKKKRRKASKILRRKAKPPRGDDDDDDDVDDDDDDDFVEKGPTLRDRSRKKPGVHRMNRAMIVSDSDSCAKSNDYEFTISEEEREQVREANEFCRSLATNLRSSRKTQEEEVPCEPRKAPVKKGKEKAEEKTNDVGKPVCGICLTEEGKNTIRGTLNCCSHYFCFACIMEWSKVESRCPLCKQRFVTISKPARCVKGFDLRNVVIPVPERDQVYQPSEEELRDFLNPYENVICTECHQGGDDALMLLCDLCDSPAHTYCVGLGREVPEGNWYCDGCRPGALGSSHPQTLDVVPEQRTSGGDTSSTYENMAEIDLNVTIPETPPSQGNGFLSPRYSGGSFQTNSPASGMGGGNTVFTRRRMQHRIHRLIYNRLNHMSLGADFDNLRSLLGVGFNSSFQHGGVRDVGTSRNAHHLDRLQETPSYGIENRDPIPGRLGELLGPVGQASSSLGGSAYSHAQWNGLNGIDLGVGGTQISRNEQLRPCTSGSSFGPDFCGDSSLDHPGQDHRANMIKQRVHSIVERQLKSLSQDINLDHEIYRDILRRSSECIMVAYGLQSRRLDTYDIRLPFCLHDVERVANVETSPIDGCCLTCFENFAKDVVKRMMDTTLGPHWLHFRH